MYIWRGKNRRDVRHALLLGDRGWVANKSDQLFDEQDEILRHEREQVHVEYFCKRIRHLMEQYLEIPNGFREIQIIHKELDKYYEYQETYLHDTEIYQQEQQNVYDNMYEIFARFIIPGSDGYKRPYSASSMRSRTPEQNNRLSAKGSTKNGKGNNEEETEDNDDDNEEYEEDNNFSLGRVDVKGLQQLLLYIGLELDEKQWAQYLKELEFSDTHDSFAFDEFFEHFQKSIHKHIKVPMWKRVNNTMKSLISLKLPGGSSTKVFFEEIDEEDKMRTENTSQAISWYLQYKLRDMEAKKILIEYAVFKSQEIAREEYRIAHPTKFICEICSESFPTEKHFTKHKKMDAAHQVFFQEKIKFQEKFELIKNALFVGDVGRQTNSNRLNFHLELGYQRHRLEHVRPDPFRPRLNDPTNHLQKLFLKGSYIQGFDATKGIRPMGRKQGLLRQNKHLALRRTHQDSLIQLTSPAMQQISNDLMRCQHNFIDIVSTQDHPALNNPKWDPVSGLEVNNKEQMIALLGQQAAEAAAAAAMSKKDPIKDISQSVISIQPIPSQVVVETVLAAGDFVKMERQRTENMLALVRFEYFGKMLNSVNIIGDFNNWKPEKCTCDLITQTFCILKELPPGMYRYRFVVDGIELVDEIASCIDDKTSPLKQCNVLLVTTNSIDLKEYNNAHFMNESIDHDSFMGWTNPQEETDGILYESTMSGVLSTASPSTKTSHKIPAFPGSPTSGKPNKHAEIGMVGLVPNPLSIAKNSKSMKASVSLKDTLQSFPSQYTMDSFSSPKGSLAKGGPARSRANTETTINTTTTTGTSVVTYQSKKGVPKGYKPLGKINHMKSKDRKTLIERIQDIDLHNYALYDDGMWALAHQFFQNPYILSINLSYNNISDDGVQGLSYGVSRLENLTTLKLNGNGFAYDGMRYLIQSLKPLKQLIHLELSNNRLGDDSIEYFCDHFLLYHDSLEVLYLDTCFMGNFGCECFKQVLLHNRHLKILSLSGNAFDERGVQCLTQGLQYNASVTSCNLSHNSLGPIGGSYVGDMLFYNDTIETMEVANIQLIPKERNYSGFFAICYALKKNCTLKKLNLSANRINENIIPELGYILSENLHLQELDLSNNPLDKKWFMPHYSFPTPKHPMTPSITSSLEKNRVYARHQEIQSTYDENTSKQVIVDDCKVGRWTNRRQWRKLQVKSKEKFLKQQEAMYQYQCIEYEKDYLRTKVDEHMANVLDYLIQYPCQEYIQTVAKAIRQYIVHDLPAFQGDRDLMTLPKNSIHSQKNHPFFRSGKSGWEDVSSVGTFEDASSLGEEKPKETVMERKLRLQGGSSSGGLSMKSFFPFSSSSSLEKDGKQMKETGNNNNQKSDKLIPRIANVDDFFHVHVSMMFTIFQAIESGSNSLVLHPERLERAMTMLAIPLLPHELQAMVDATIVPSIQRLSIHKVSNYLLTNIQRFMTQKNSWLRYRLLSDVYLHLPVEEAQKIILNTIAHAAFLEIRENYRKHLIIQNPKEKLFVCAICARRFPTKRLLQKHETSEKASKLYHKRYYLQEMIYSSQVLFLQEIKFTLTGAYFPSYYELLPEKSLPAEYFPQIFDRTGTAGRPMGVVESYRTLRALDGLGDYLLVSIRGQLGWIRYRKGRQQYLRPLAGFDWHNLYVPKRPWYFRVNDNLPSTIELKLRHRPSTGHDEEILGYLKQGQVIQVLGRIDNWLQVKYHQEDAAWVLLYSKSDLEANDIPQMDVHGRPTTTAATASSTARMTTADTTAAGKRASTKSSFFNSMKTVTFQQEQEAETASIVSAGAQSTHTPIPGVKKTLPFEKMKAPIRKRKIDNAVIPLNELDANDEDVIFRDHILTYELNGKKLKHNILKNPNFTRYKCTLFDDIRYGDVEKNTALHYMIEVPAYLSNRMIQEYQQKHSKKALDEPLPDSPFSLSQERILEMLTSISEGELREYYVDEIREREDTLASELELQGMKKYFNKFGRSLKDDIYAIQDEDEEDEQLYAGMLEDLQHVEESFVIAEDDWA